MRKIGAELENPLDSWVIEGCELLAVHVFRPHRWTPNQVTHVSLLCGILAIYLYYRGVKMKRRELSAAAAATTGPKSTTGLGQKSSHHTQTGSPTGAFNSRMKKAKHSDLDLTQMDDTEADAASVSLELGDYNAHELRELVKHQTSGESGPAWFGSRIWIGGAVLFYWLQYFFDCADGYWARNSQMETLFGDFYDHGKDLVCVVLFTCVALRSSGRRMKEIFGISAIAPAPAVVATRCQPLGHTRLYASVLLTTFLIYGMCTQLGCQQAHYHLTHLAAPGASSSSSGGRSPTSDSSASPGQNFLDIFRVLLAPNHSLEEAEECMRTYRFLGCGTAVASYCLLILYAEMTNYYS